MSPRRQFLQLLPAIALADSKRVSRSPAPQSAGRPPRIRFAVIGINHSHINGQVQIITRSGGQLVAVYAKEPDLAAGFSKRFPEARLARSEQEILDDPTIPLIVSASIPNERAPLGVRAMEHGKDFMVDKPAATTLEQLDDLRRVQARTKRIFSVL